MATKMPMRVALANATIRPAEEEDPSVASEMYNSLPEGLRRAGEKLIGAPKELYDWTHEPEGREFPQATPMPAQPSIPQAAPPVPEPTKPPPKQVVSEAARQAAELYREVGPQPPARPAAPVEPTSFARVKLPSGEWAEAGSPKIAGSFGKDKFASSRSGAEPVNTSPADQQLDWMSFLDVRDRQKMAQDEERAGSEARTAASRASTARSTLQEKEPFYAEELAASSNRFKSMVTGQTEATRRNFIENTIRKAEARINQLRNDPLADNPKYASWDPRMRRQHFEQMSPEERAKVAPTEKDRRAAEQQIMDEVYLALSALTETNLHPRASNPLEGIINAAASGAEPKKE